MVGDGASSHKIDYVERVWNILNLEGHQNRITGSRVMAVLLNWWNLPIGEVASGRVCLCSLRSRLVYPLQRNKLQPKMRIWFFIIHKGNSHHFPSGTFVLQVSSARFGLQSVMK